MHTDVHVQSIEDSDDDATLGIVKGNPGVCGRFLLLAM